MIDFARLLGKLYVAAWLVDHEHTRIARWFYRRAGIPQTIPGRLGRSEPISPLTGRALEVRR